jgi:serine/threonine protein phosphatase PrpC
VTRKTDTKAAAIQFFTELLKRHNIAIPANRSTLLNEFLQKEENAAAIDIILQNQHQLMAKWTIENRIAEIKAQPVRILNATVGKPYESRLNFDQLKWNDLVEYQFSGLEELGMRFDDNTKQIVGTPIESGDKKIVFKFKVSGQQQDQPFSEKPITLIINPDPRKLWKTVPSDKTDPYWKEDDVTLFQPFGDRHLLVSSKRGRSHANVGSFREDDFSFGELANGWNIIVVADGAGSAKISRKGSAIACESVLNYFREPVSVQEMAPFDDLIGQYKHNPGDETLLKINRLVYNNLGKAVFQVHKRLEQFAATNNLPLKDLNSTLIFSLIKKYDEGYAVLSFGVGDCPIAVLNQDISEVTLMNWLDVGEFGGGTRFITMPEIFRSEKFATRFGFRLLEDFSYLLLMSDGIYDPKFVVESALADIKKWRNFLDDLQGKNEDGITVGLTKDNADIVDQFSRWMDFWSPGNHDDRTLAIIF